MNQNTSHTTSVGRTPEDAFAWLDPVGQDRMEVKLARAKADKDEMVAGLALVTKYMTRVLASVGQPGGFTMDEALRKIHVYRECVFPEMRRDR
jgi:hypothetical protein